MKMLRLLLQGAWRGTVAFCTITIALTTGGAAQVPEEDWIVFGREADPAGFVISVNQAISSGRVSLASSDCHELQFQFTPLQLTENGMPNPETQALYHAVEDRVTKAIGPSGGQIVAMRTGQNSRSVWFCGPRTIKPAVHAAIAELTDFRIVLRAASISDIRALHPTILEAQLSRNQQLLGYLAQKGDDQSVPRKTSHFIYNHTTANRYLIEARLQTLGFQLDPHRPDINPEALVFFRFAPLELDALDSDVRTLNKLCLEFGCDYDGWETEFVKDTKN